MLERLVVRSRRVGLVVCMAMLGCTACSMNREHGVQMERDRMIVDRLTRSQHYCNMHPAFESAFAFLKQSNLADLPTGRHDIDGDRLFCMISKGPARTRAEARLEAHRKYIDIQYVIAGSEEMGWKPTADCTLVDTSYDADRDIEFFKDEPETWTPVPPGSFVIFFPQDAHAPLVGTGQIHKAVLKIAVE